MMIVLASASPRRKQLMTKLGYEFFTDVSNDDEEIINYRNGFDYVRQAALKKGQTIAKKYQDNIIISADTIVLSQGKILGKPKNINEAREMILSLNNQYHHVITGVVVIYKNKINVFTEKTKVYVDHITKEEIEEYINTNEPYDKAGGYGIQGDFSKYIKKIKGDYYNVMGLPLNKLYQVLKKIKND